MSNSEFDLDVDRGNTALNFLPWIRQAQQSGKGLGGMVMEIMRLRRGQGKLQPDEYFMYGMYDDARFTAESRKTFLGQDNLLVPSPWAKIAGDKPTLTTLLTGMGLPVPETQAIVHPFRTFANAFALRNPADVANFLRKDARYPIFGKPFDSVCSMGTAKIDRYDAEHDAVIVSGDKVVPVDAFAKKINELGLAYLFQTLMLPHPEIAKLIGPCVSSVRMFVISDRDGAALFRAAWKIPASVNHADNFWRVGNILAGVDIETGKILRTVVRTEDGTEPIAAHPITDAVFDGMVFPEWDAMKHLVMQAAINLPHCHFQGWDVALTDRGPILVELEGDGGNPIMEQLCFDTGLLQGRYLKVVEEYNEREKQSQKRNRSRDAAALRKSVAALAVPFETRRTNVDSNEDASSELDDSTVKTTSAPIVIPTGTSIPTDSNVTV
ncbi:sugar-transfer associated ATP-grasp domain-containing protein [Stieleria varia]|uniref:Alpha-L-glutamate ligase-related protein ATP-grasp domain-containing protein n=1 Tax=Stieleria varia TaxID=2528005 RepID=A0A5C6AYY1_9BACT|nr:sugar-transfer associated ATP-grasp domain-containing protein [Stieleria varia]TWU04890.1 hypothetical protein Pla52n_29350 [Stieleria varia]